MKKKTHNYRMRAIGTYADPYNLSMGEKLANKFRDDPAHQEYIKKTWAKCLAIFEAQCKNGAGLEIDKILRYFLQEYNDRNFKHGLNSMPTSFNVMEAFLEHRPDLVYFKLRDERDHRFLLSEYFDFLTSPDNDCKTESLMDLLEEGVIYSYNSCENLEDFILSAPEKENYVISGISLIRHSTELNMLMLIGKEADLPKETSELQGNGIAICGRDDIVPSPDLKREAVAIEGGSNFWKHLVLTRFDLADKTQDVRYILKDCGNAFNVLTDDVNVFLDESGNLPVETRNALTSSVEGIEANRFIFELCKNLILLPAYFEKNDDQLEFESCKTQLWGMLGKRSWRKKGILLEPEDRITTRQVAVLRTMSASQNSFCSVSMTPELKIQRSGYWRTLPANKIGLDKDNKPIHGRTWVHETLSWIEKDEDSTDIITGTKHDDQDFSKFPNNGYIYIMRSASDKKNIFKVGLTRRIPEQRATEISCGTGVPTSYLVVEEWYVADCVLAESFIHKELSEYRINKRREFFNAPYKIIRKAVEENIDRANQSVMEDKS